ncbi:DUF1329 domain-containing protein [Cupriavidus necator]
MQGARERESTSTSTRVHRIALATVCLMALGAPVLSVMSTNAVAAVSADEAAKLKTTLTPLGGERAASKDGSIPAWDGGMSSATGPKVGDVPSALFAGEKPIAQITAKNMAQYVDKLTDGTQALLKKYPDTFRVDVYPTHRTAVASQLVYDNTFKNATRCKTRENGMSLEGCFGGIPFPIPKDGAEALWNFQMRVQPESVQMGFKNIVGASDGNRTIATRGDNSWNFPFYYKDGSLEKWPGTYLLQRFTATEPPFRAGESLVVHDSIDIKQSREAWQYLVGQRRVRRAPTVGYDTPDFMSSGAHYFDEVMGFSGDPSRFEWKLVGKKEMIIPYNDNAFVTAKVDDAFAKHHVNPDKLRWETHRVWVLEATLAPGKRHAVPKRRYYLDEDSWTMSLADGYDAQGNLWRTEQVPPFVVPAVPALVIAQTIIYNLQADTYSSVVSLNGESYRVGTRRPDNFFTGEAAAADATR